MTPSQPDSNTLDPLHAMAVETACAADRERAEAGTERHVRLAVEHEFCQPGRPCVTWPMLVVVTSLAPGVRIRQPLAAAEVAA